MDKGLATLISDFQKSVLDAVVFMQRSGINMPSSVAEWIESDFYYNRNLDDGITFFKHGAGCTVGLISGEVDFDFGKDGAIGGFDSWRLIRFAGNEIAKYGFNSTESLMISFKAALNEGALVHSEPCLFYLVNAPRVYAADIDYRFPGDMLPINNKDIILTLSTHHFTIANLMFKSYQKMNDKFDSKGYVSINDEVNFRSYASSWLGFLAVVCEGFKKSNVRVLLEKHRPDNFKRLIPIADELGKAMKKNYDALRMLRNNIFHLRENLKAVRDFFLFEDERVLWALDLHKSFEHFFSKYRVFCEVHYILNKRKAESELGRRKKRNVKKPR
ncbi:hypothetical protein [Erwinia sp. E602]|uniref:DUF6896 domain-containing protein n=1 Tax=Erwinia sp. E602 TaxID=2675378 RepID=UPI001BA6FD36|nr:hypothetical protein [Erwinia sp. E602]